MECENAYKKNGIRYILCRKEKDPSTGNMGTVTHAMCGFQKFCPEKHCTQMLPGWRGCLRRDCNKPSEPQEVAEESKPKKEADKPRKKKSSQKASEQP